MAKISGDSNLYIEDESLQFEVARSQFEVSKLHFEDIYLFEDLRRQCEAPDLQVTAQGLQLEVSEL